MSIKKITLQSDALGKEMNTLLYLPEQYDDCRQFPVLYFFHGRNGNENILFEIEQEADQMIRSGLIKPLLIVCPCIDNSQGMNSSPKSQNIPDPGDLSRRIHLGRYEDYIIQEVIPTIDSQYCTIKNRSFRYIGGVSGGGYAALHNAFRHQNLFSKVGGHIPAIEVTLEEEDKPFYSNLVVWNSYNPIYLALHKQIHDLQVYLDCGDQDEGGFYRGCAHLQKALEEKGIASEYHLNPGHHDIAYVKSHIRDYLLFYAGSE
jgi:Enterochelin esterase and related enzymes